MRPRSISYSYTGSLLAAISIVILVIYLLTLVPGMDDVRIEAFVLNAVFDISAASFVLLMPIVATVYFSKSNELEREEYMNLSVLRYAVGYLMFFYGLSKMTGKFFDVTYLTQDSRVIDVDSFAITWYYFGKSNAQEFIIGLLEFVPAILILFRRTAFVGALMLLPVSMNVLLTNIFNHISGLTLPVSLIIALANIYILYSNKKQIVLFLKSMAPTSTPKFTGGWQVARISLKVTITGMMVVFAAVSVYSVLPFLKKVSYSGHNKITGGYELATLAVNGRTVNPANDSTRYYRAIYLEPQSRWNSVKYFSTAKMRVLKIRWSATSDSVTTFLKTGNDVGIGTVDSTTRFVGTYKLVNNKLYVQGLQYGDTINAVYNKKDLKDYKWFW